MDIKGQIVIPWQKTVPRHHEPVLVNAKTTQTSVYRVLKEYLAENLTVGVLVALLVLSDLAVLGVMDPTPTSARKGLIFVPVSCDFVDRVCDGKDDPRNHTKRARNTYWTFLL
jgi:hypothetical protein